MSNARSISFLPEDFLRRKVQRRTNIIGGALLIVVLFAIASAQYITQRALGRTQFLHGVVMVEYNNAAQQIDQFRQMQAKHHALTGEAELTASLLEKVPRSYLLAELANAMPPGVSMLDFSLDSLVKLVAPVSKSGESPRHYDVTMKLTGTAENDIEVAHYVSRLSRSSLLGDVNLIVSEDYEKSNQKLRRFQVEMTLNSTAEVTPATLKSRTAAVQLGGE